MKILQERHLRLSSKKTRIGAIDKAILHLRKSNITALSTFSFENRSSLNSKCFTTEPK